MPRVFFLKATRNAAGPWVGVRELMLGGQHYVTKQQLAPHSVTQSSESTESRLSQDTDCEEMKSFVSGTAPGARGCILPLRRVKKEGQDIQGTFIHHSSS